MTPQSGGSGYLPANYTGRSDGELKSGLAIASLIVGIISFMTFGLLGIGALIGIILGIVALMRTNREPSRYGGKTLAITGLVLSATSLVIVIPVGVIAAIAIPNLLAARRAANEGSSITSLRQILNAETTYYGIHEKYGTLEELAAAELLPSTLSSGIRNGYKFRIDLPTRNYPQTPGFEAVGVPVTYPNNGRNSFYIDETGIIRAADNHGSDATRLDSPLEFDDDYPSDSAPSRRHSPTY